MGTRYTSVDVARKVALINERLIAAGREPMHAQSSNPDGSTRRYEFAGWVYVGAGEACRALDAVLFFLREFDLSEKERAYVARAIDVARSDGEASQLLDPAGRDELLRRFGGRR